MANSDNLINIGDTWKAMSTIQINIGDVWKDVNTAYINIGDTWKEFWTSTVADSSRGVFGGGSPLTNVIDYITINTTGNATDFGDLTSVRFALGSTSSGTNNRGVFGGGQDDGFALVNVIDYITINTTGNATDFGDLTATIYYIRATSNGTNNRGVFGGGFTSFNLNIIDYITINTTGNATDFGDLTIARRVVGATSNGTNNRGVFGGGNNTSNTATNVIDYITINTTGNATDFGDLTVARQVIGSTSSGTNNRGVFGGGQDAIFDERNVIDYITINTTGNATDFGDLTATIRDLAACSNA